MKGRVLGAGVLGALVMVVASFVVNGILGFTARLELRPVPNEAAGLLLLLRLVVVLVATTVAAWIVSMASDRVLASYARRFGFFVLMGLWLAVFSDLPRYDIGAHPWSSAVALGAFDVALWALAGSVMAWRLRPPQLMRESGSSSTGTSGS